MIDTALLTILVTIAFGLPAWFITRDIDADDRLDNRF